MSARGRCGIYDSLADKWTSSDGLHHVRCSVCQHTWTHNRPASALALYSAHLALAVSR